MWVNENFEWEKLEIDSAKFIFQESEKNLMETIKTAELHTSRAVTVLKFSIPITITLLAVLSRNFDLSSIQSQLAVLGVLFSLITIWKSFRIYDIYGIRPIGNQPVNFLKNEYVEDPSQKLLYWYTAINACQLSINDNNKSNADRGKQVNDLLDIIRIGLYSIVLYAGCFLLASRLFALVEAVQDLQVVVSALSSVVLVALVAVVVEYFHRRST